jgi:Ca-activated chloride channel homolog
VIAYNQKHFWLVSIVLLCFAPHLQSQAKKPAIPSFKVDVDVVFVKVSVTDPFDRYVTGLEKENFKVYEDDVEQTISHFDHESAPISVGIIFDVSHSMSDNNNIRKAKRAFARFLQLGNRGDEYLLITFNHVVKLVQAFTDESSYLENDIAFQKPGGNTAVFDAVYMGLGEVKAGRNDKKALILITDGEDNRSRYTPIEVREFSRECAVQVYAIGQHGRLGYGGGILENIASFSGGRVYFPRTFNELEYYIDLIHAELRNQYLLAYVPTNTAHDGKWRKIKVKVETPEGFSKLKVRARQGYNAPKN